MLFRPVLSHLRPLVAGAARRLPAAPRQRAFAGLPRRADLQAPPARWARRYAGRARGQHEEQNDDGGGSEGYPDYSGRRVLLLRPTLWALTFTAGAYYVCSSAYVDRQEEEARREARGALGLLWARTGADTEAERIHALMGDARVRRLVGGRYRVASEAHARAVRRIAHLPEWVPFELRRSAAAAAGSWYGESRATRCVYTLVGINAAVFAMWRLPRLLPFMARRFLHDPRSGRSYTLLTSAFSHRDLWHFGFNMMALASFGRPVAEALGPEHFTAFYLSAAMASGLASHLLSPLRAATILPTLGASGAVYAVVGMTMMLFPESKIALIFLPFIPVTISQAFPALLAYDFVGAALNWTAFNHIAHLGGGLYGLAYVQWCSGLWGRAVRAVVDRRVAKRASAAAAAADQ
ncbi:hypothetical protein H4R18_000066 [Coemansia javaensis]|uniref:Peptidase S54 rhomboid domain-containing protein n=1 Tax=Coemansia javaensis TaxID=2761396 RepID=A0A9W8HJA4_9FUNG|nr:hypothetical protein H4R18_000066 [Coemansia javaensis]